jgi:GNAT superfamily N-acetyltransferase
VELVPGYGLRRGTGLDRALLVKFMRRTYRELYPDESLVHLAQTVEQYFSSETPLWWVEAEAQQPQELELEQDLKPIGFRSTAPTQSPALVACLWLGTAVDQISGRQYPHIFLLYVSPEHRRRGIGAALMQHVEDWAKAKGEFQIGLQVFQHNQPALQLYQKLGYQPQSIWMVKLINRI